MGRASAPVAAAGRGPVRLCGLARQSGLARISGRPAILYAHIAREFALSLLVAFLFFFVVFFVNQLLLMAEDILAKRAPLWDVFLLLVYAMPSVVAMSFPFAALVGGLMAAGSLAASNEILVIQAAGVPARRVFMPFAVLALAVSLFSFVMNDFFLPLGTVEFGKLYRKLLVSSPALELEPWTARRYRGVTIVTGAVTGDAVEDVVLFDRGGEGSGRVIAAKRARLLSSGKDDGYLLLRLEEVWTQESSDSAPGRFEYSTCDSLDYRIETRERGEASASIGPREMSSKDLGRVIRDKAAAFDGRRGARAAEIAALRASLAEAYAAATEEGLNYENARGRLQPLLKTLRELESSPLEDRSLKIYELEYYKKFSIPFGALCFVTLAFPLGLRARRAGRSVGFGLGLLLAVLYWALLLAGQTFGTRLGWSPFWSMWLPNAFVLASGALLWIAGGLAR
ncbi:MAG: LptF/LptG family permease [Spirochaetaceae bacterium]|nr:LptF/LptG family permease [Spirochaetaceae bacterium]